MNVRSRDLRHQWDTPSVMHMGMRRYTRLANSFLKEIENLEHALAFHFVHYNFVWIHKTLKTMPALGVGITNKLWSMEDLAKLLD